MLRPRAKPSTSLGGEVRAEVLEEVDGAAACALFR